MAHGFKKVKGDFFDIRYLGPLKMLIRILKSPVVSPKCILHERQPFHLLPCHLP